MGDHHDAEGLADLICLLLKWRASIPVLLRLSKVGPDFSIQKMPRQYKFWLLRQPTALAGFGLQPADRRPVLAPSDSGRVHRSCSVPQVRKKLGLGLCR